jgi:hypothetical protein
MLKGGEKERRIPFESMTNKVEQIPKAFRGILGEKI